MDFYGRFKAKLKANGKGKNHVKQAVRLNSERGNDCFFIGGYLSHINVFKELLKIW